MSLAVSWLLFPVVLGTLCVGCGLLVESASGRPLPRSVLPPLGFALIVVVALATTTNSRTAHLTTPVIVGLAVAGIVLALPLRPPWHLGWEAVLAGVVFAVFGAPVYLSGNATFAGYISLDDTATWLAFADRLLEHGRNTTGLAPSTYEATLSINLSQNGYPAGAFPPLGVMHELLGTDSAWLFQPYVAILGALLALTLYALTARVIRPRPLRALGAFVAAQPALLYGYSLWGGVKEMAAAVLLALVAALTPGTLRDGARARSLLPLATAAAALIGVLSFDGAVWIAPILVPTLVVGLRRTRWRFVRLTVAFLAVGAVLSVPTILLTGRFLRATGGLTTNDLGNLIHPLSTLQVFGIWPAGDFRFRPADYTATIALIAVIALAACAGLVWAWKCGEWPLLLYTAGGIGGCATSVLLGSPWIAGKSLAIASPVAITAAMAGVGWLVSSRVRAAAVVPLLVIGGGVLWSNALAYHDVWLAPRSQLGELETIGSKFSGQGPALLSEYAPYGVRHFLRHLDPESPSELRRRPDLLIGGGELAKGEYADIDQFQLPGILVYRTLVLPRSPTASRPPSTYLRVWSGRYYEVWQRPDRSSSRIIEHVPLGAGLQPSSVPPCSTVLRLGREAAASNGRLATAFRRPAIIADLATATLPAGWHAARAGSAAVYPSTSGSLDTAFTVPTRGRYAFLLGGSFRRALELSVDGRVVGNAQDHLNHPGIATPLGEANLTAGSHRLGLRYRAATLSPGSGGPVDAIGPIVLDPITGAPSVTYVQPGEARSLCGKNLDWLEAVTG
jgi:hypothetical protein